MTRAAARKEELADLFQSTSERKTAAFAVVGGTARPGKNAEVEAEDEDEFWDNVPV